MASLQIVMIWGAVYSALFSFPAQAGEWENFKDIKEALVRSNSKRDMPLPPWVAVLEYKREAHWYDPQKPIAKVNNDEAAKADLPDSSAPVERAKSR